MTTTNTTTNGGTLAGLKKELAEALEEERLAKEKVRNVRQSIAGSVKELKQLIDDIADLNVDTKPTKTVTATSAWTVFFNGAKFVVMFVCLWFCMKLLAPSTASGVPPEPVVAAQEVPVPVAVSDEAVSEAVINEVRPEVLGQPDSPETVKQVVSSRPKMVCTGNSCNVQRRPYRGWFWRW